LSAASSGAQPEVIGLVRQYSLLASQPVHRIRITAPRARGFLESVRRRHALAGTTSIHGRDGASSHETKGSADIMQQRIARFRPINRLDAMITQWLTRHSVQFVRVSLGFVFLAFGILKFFPGVSPAEEIAERAMVDLTFGLVPEDAGRLLVALMETAIGVSLLTGTHLRLGMSLLGMAMIGVLSPLVLFPGELFSGSYNAPTLEGQYVLKDVVLLASALVVGLKERGAEMIIVPEGAVEPDEPPFTPLRNG
jgi:putative oxidoreductase